MKILYLCSDLGVPVLGRKGAAVHVRELVSAFARAGHQVIVAAPVLKKAPWEPAAEIAATVLPVPVASWITEASSVLKGFNERLGVDNALPAELRRILFNHDFAAELRRRFAADPPDFIYERAALFGTAGVALARELNAPLLLELNAPLALEQSSYRGAADTPLAAKVERWTLARADAVLAVSAPLRAHAIKHGAKAARIHVLPNGVDPTRFHPAQPEPSLRRRLGLKEGPVLGFVGGLRPWHGVETLPELAARLCRRHAGLQLVIVGEGPLRPQLERAFAKKRLQRHVRFTGNLAHEEIPDVIRQFDVALAPYRRLDHAFYFSPLKLFEYMGCGIAVVAAKVGQIAEVVRHGKTGLLYPPGNLGALVGATQRLLENPGLRAQLGRAAAKQVHQRHTWDQNAERVVQLAGALTLARPKR